MATVAIRSLELRKGGDNRDKDGVNLEGKLFRLQVGKCSNSKIHTS